MASRGVVVALAVVLLPSLSCRDRAGEQRAGAGDEGAAATPVERAAERAPGGLERGDRHARAAARRAFVVKRVEGTVASVDRRQVVIRRRGAPELALRVSPRTKVTVNGRPAELDGLREGAEVRAAYQAGQGGGATALSIDARPAAAPQDGARRRPAPAPVLPAGER